ncbi:flavin reductase family protein [Nocardioides dubius]|uniref:Flavin reductase like domain-containing protein n=1 Tax=Nocardioides dubius TaxID=317019 RepID=A0ABP4EG84_9ACTN
MTEPIFDTREFRNACGQFPTGVTAVTASTADGRVAALTVNSFTSVSLDPPQVLFCLATSSSSYDILEAADRIAVHILSEDQEEVARRFATSGLSGEKKLEGTDWSTGPGGVPELAGTAATLIGAPGERILSGDHVIILVDVDHVRHKESVGGSLGFYQGRFLQHRK